MANHCACIIKHWASFLSPCTSLPCRQWFSQITTVIVLQGNTPMSVYIVSYTIQLFQLVCCQVWFQLRKQLPQSKFVLWQWITCLIHLLVPEIPICKLILTIQLCGIIFHLNINMQVFSITNVLQKFSLSLQEVLKLLNPHLQLAHTSWNIRRLQSWGRRPSTGTRGRSRRNCLSNHGRHQTDQCCIIRYRGPGMTSGGSSASSSSMPGPPPLIADFDSRFVKASILLPNVPHDCTAAKCVLKFDLFPFLRPQGNGKNIVQSKQRKPLAKGKGKVKNNLWQREKLHL